MNTTGTQTHQQVIDSINEMLNATPAADAPTYRVASTPTGYEVHRTGCKHLNARHIQGHWAYPGTTGAETAAAFAATNEDMTATLGPCAR